MVYYPDVVLPNIETFVKRIHCPNEKEDIFPMLSQVNIASCITIIYMYVYVSVCIIPRGNIDLYTEESTVINITLAN